jgi:serine/threonine protein kinase
MSPEQARGQRADGRSDIWSLGAVIYEMVGGVPAFSGATPSDCIASILKNRGTSFIPRSTCSSDPTTIDIAEGAAEREG